MANDGLHRYDHSERAKVHNVERFRVDSLFLPHHEIATTIILTTKIPRAAVRNVPCQSIVPLAVG